MILLLLCGDVEVNPGPVSFPCTVCGKSVAEVDRAIECDSCSLWCHALHDGISEAEYNVLPDDSFDWVCPKCTLSAIFLRRSEQNR